MLTISSTIKKLAGGPNQDKDTEEIRTTGIRKRTNVFICNDMITWVKSSSESTNILELIKEFSEIIGIKFGMQNSRVPVTSCL